jgi:hypothetical protein
MKTKDTDLIKELIVEPRICNCSELGELALEELLLRLCSNIHHGSHSRTNPLCLWCLLIILFGRII